MRFGIYCEIQTPPGKSHYDMIWEIMRQIEHADDVGFDVYSAIDHHFFQKFSISANPLAGMPGCLDPQRCHSKRVALATTKPSTSWNLHLPKISSRTTVSITK